MPKINLYPDMNAQIADLLLDCTDSGMMLYAGTYIKDLERQLAEYQTAEEQGRLLRLPCAFGTTIYWLRPNAMGVPVEVLKTQFGVGLIDAIHLFGKILFLTKEEAEQALSKV